GLPDAPLRREAHVGLVVDHARNRLDRHLGALRHIHDGGPRLHDAPPGFGEQIGFERGITSLPSRRLQGRFALPPEPPLLPAPSDAVEGALTCVRLSDNSGQGVARRRPVARQSRRTTILSRISKYLSARQPHGAAGAPRRPLSAPSLSDPDSRPAPAE